MQAPNYNRVRARFPIRDLERYLFLIHRTSDQHDADAEDFFRQRVGRHVAEADAGEAGAGEVERRHVAVPLRQTVHGHLLTHR